MVLSTRRECFWRGTHVCGSSVPLSFSEHLALSPSNLYCYLLRTTTGRYKFLSTHIQCARRAVEVLREFQTRQLAITIEVKRDVTSNLHIHNKQFRLEGNRLIVWLLKNLTRNKLVQKQFQCQFKQNLVSNDISKIHLNPPWGKTFINNLIIVLLATVN